MTTMDEVSGAPRSGSASATSHSSSNPGYQLHQQRRPPSSIEMYDLGPFTVFPAYSPRYASGLELPSRTSDVANDFLGLQGPALSYLSPDLYTNKQIYSSMSLSNDTSPQPQGENYLGAMRGDDSISYETAQRSLGSSDSYVSPVYTLETQPMYDSLCSTEERCGSPVPDYAFPGSYPG